MQKSRVQQQSNTEMTAQFSISDLLTVLLEYINLYHALWPYLAGFHWYHDTWQNSSNYVFCTVAQNLFLGGDTISIKNYTSAITSSATRIPTGIGPRAWRCKFCSEVTVINNAPILRYFDPTLPVILWCDASECGLRYVLQGQPVALGAQGLTQTERNYAQIEKRCLPSSVAVRI